MHEWSASWIGPEYHPRGDLGLFTFRRSLQLDAIPDSLCVHVSADQRYILRVNGRIVHRGPQRGTPAHWHFDRLDLAAFLIEGENLIEADVWNFGWFAPMAQHSVRTAFLLEAEAPFESLSTPNEWQVCAHPEFDFAMLHDGVGEFYIDIGPGEIVDRSDAHAPVWRAAHRIGRAESRGQLGGGAPWSLAPRTLPLFPEGESVRSLGAWIRTADGDRPWASGESLNPGEELVLDFGELLCAYPVLDLAAESHAEVRITFAESPWNDDGTKGNRHEWRGKRIGGIQDRFTVGATPTTWSPVWWRTFRYVSITASSPIVRLSCSAQPTGYPYRVESTFSCDDARTAPIWDVAIRTLERCAGETYFDCPYYEQLQYVGDTRIQALCGYYLSRDRALQRNAIRQFGESILEGGLTQSRYPSRQLQVIPPFSLIWVLMLYDAWRYDAPEVVQPWLSRAEGVLEAYARILRDEDPAYWPFGDWIPGWRWGVPPGGAKAEMHRLMLDLARAALGAMADPHKGFLWPANRSREGESTQHAEALWRYGQRLAGHTIDPWPADLQAPDPTFYFQYYVHQAVQPDPYLDVLGPWTAMIEQGLSTFAETPEPTRSDCHAWSAHPALGFFRILAGIESDAPGWQRARIAPQPGGPQRFDARVAHPNGDLRVCRSGPGLTVETPVPTVVHWNGAEWNLEPGRYEL